MSRDRGMEEEDLACGMAHGTLLSRKRKEMPPLARAWTDLEGMMPRATGQTEKDKRPTISRARGFQSATWTEPEVRPVAAGGGAGARAAGAGVAGASFQP